MKTLILSVVAFAATGLSAQGQSVEGKAIFSGNCQVCHSIGQGKIVGPDLEGITERRDAEWIKQFITNSQKMVAEGNEQAVEVFNEFNKIPMPSHNFNDEEMNQLLSYMEEAGKEAKAAVQEETDKASAPPAENPEKAEATVALSSSLSWYLNSLVGLLGVIAVILSITAAYLYRIVKT